MPVTRCEECGRHFIVPSPHLFDGSSSLCGPCQYETSPDSVPHGSVLLRDYFASAALTGYLAAHADSEVSIPIPVKVAEMAYQYADAMIRVRES